jgi:hypothetical protein
MNRIKKSILNANSDDISVVASEEENPGRETEVDSDEEHPALFGSEQDEDMGLDSEPLQKSIPRDRPLDITPVSESDGSDLGLVDHSDAETMARYQRAAEEDAFQRRKGA